MSKKHKKKARATVVKPHTVKEAKRRKRLRDEKKSNRISNQARQSSKTTDIDSSSSGGGTNDLLKEKAEKITTSTKSENPRTDATNSNAKEVDRT